MMEREQLAPELAQDYFNNDQVAERMGISTKSLDNRIYAEGREGPYPPFTGRGKNRRFPKVLFQEWEIEQAKKNQPRKPGGRRVS